MLLYTKKYTNLESREKVVKKVAKIKAAFHNPFSPTGRCDLLMTNDDTPQNFTSQRI
jgi:hypothetical protein